MCIKPCVLRVKLHYSARTPAMYTMDNKSSSLPQWEPREKEEVAVEYPQISQTGMLLKLIGGATIPTKKRGVCLYHLHRVYNIAFVAYCLITLFLETIELRDCYGDLDRLTRNLGMVLTHIMGTVKSVLLYRNEEKFKIFDDTLNKKNLRYKGEMENTSLMFITDGKRLIDFVGCTFSLLAVGVGISGYISSMLKFRQANIDGSFPVNVTCERLLPYPCHVFFEVDTISGCSLMLFLYCISLELYAVPIVAFDIMFAATIITIKANFQVIGAAFNSVRERSLQQLGYSIDTKAFRDEEVPGLNKQMLDEITTATVHFQNILRLCTEIENIFGMVILFQLAGSLAVTSALLCITATGDVTLAETVSTIQFYSAMSFELAIFCYFGNELTQAYEELTHSLYDSNWFSSSVPYKKHMLITMTRLQIPVYVTIGKLSPLTLSTLQWVVQASFKILALYRSISE